jgi:hypothetical protein
MTVPRGELQRYPGGLTRRIESSPLEERNGTEKITKAHLDAVILDIAAGNQYEARRRPRQ